MDVQAASGVRPSVPVGRHGRLRTALVWRGSRWTGSERVFDRGFHPFNGERYVVCCKAQWWDHPQCVSVRS